MKYLLYFAFYFLGVNNAWLYGQTIPSAPNLKKVLPDYGNNTFYVEWDAISNAEDYEVKVNAQGGGGKTFYICNENIPCILTTHLTTEALNPDLIYTFSVKVMINGEWSEPSNIKLGNFHVIWPVSKNTSCNSTVDNLGIDILTGFNTPIKTKQYAFHEGLDIQGDPTLKNECVYSPVSGIISKVSFNPNKSYENSVTIEILYNNNKDIIGLGHLSEIYVSDNQVVFPGTLIGKVSALFSESGEEGFTGKSHCHLEWREYSASTDFKNWNKKNPLLLFNSSIYRDPLGIAPQIESSNPSRKAIRFRKSPNDYFDNDLSFKQNPDVNKIVSVRRETDIVAECFDQQSSASPRSSPNYVGYYAEYWNGIRWTHAVASEKKPYVLINNGEGWFKAPQGLEGEPENTIAVNALVDKDIKYSPPGFDQNYGNYYFAYIVTNASGYDGKYEDLKDEQCWATDARENEIILDNGYRIDYDRSRCIDESLFTDGKYKVGIVVKDLVHSPVNASEELIVDNFRPFVKKVVMKTDATKKYSAEWKWDRNTGTLKFQPNASVFEVRCSDIIVAITASEPMKDMRINISTLTTTGQNTFTVNSSEPKENTNQTIWEFKIPESILKPGTHTLIINGHDLNDNKIQGFAPGVNEITGADIPKHQHDGSWLPNISPVADAIHQFKVPSSHQRLASDNSSVNTEYQLQDDQDMPKVTISGGGQFEYCSNSKPVGFFMATVTGGVPPYTFIGSFTQECNPPSPNSKCLTVHGSSDIQVLVTDDASCQDKESDRIIFIPILCLRSHDPNDLLGPSGLDSIRWVARKDTLPYTIHFENDPRSATGPAQRVRLELPLDAEADPSNFRVGRFGFAGKTFEVPAGRIQYQGRVDARDSVGVFVDVTAGVDAAGHKAFWIFQAVDPATGLPPADGSKGLLPVNDSITNKGQGFVEFSIKARTSTATGDIVNGKADIIFDANDVIPTNLWANVVDAVAPASEMQAASVSTEIDSTNIPLSWTAQDDPGGCGIGGYNLYVSEDGGPFEKTLGGWQDTFLLYGAERGHTYRFFVQAADRVGNNEPLKNAAEVTVRVKSNPRLDILSVNSINLCSGDSLQLVWASEEIDSVHIAYSTDNGLSYNTVKASLRDSLGHFAFTADDYTQDQVLLLRIADAATPSKQEDTVTVVIHPRASVTITSPETVICAGNPLELTASGTVSTFYWSPYYSVDVPDTNKVQVTATKTTRFFVTGRDLHGCIAVDSVDVTIHPRDSIYLESIVCSAADSGRVLTVLQSQFGCDSIILHAFSLDTLSPIAISKDTTLQLDGADQAAITPQDLNDGTFDDCSFSLSLSRSAFTCADVGSQLVWLIATDALGNQDSVASTVTVHESSKPVITCPANAIIAANAGCTGIVGVWNLSAKTDNCTASSSITESQSPASSIILSGHDTEQIVTLTAHDGSGNTETCTFTVTLKDIGGPAITCPPNATVAADANCTGTVGAWSLLTKTDNCTASGSITESQNPASSTVLSGHDDAQTVTLTAYDDHSNSGTCTFTVTLKDATKPVITCPANSTVAADANCSGTVGTWSLLTKTDNCTAWGSITESQSPMGGATWSGHNAVQTVTLTANDGHGNTEACTFTLTLKDTDIPVITCPANATVAANASCGGTVGAWSLLTKIDICSASSSISESQSPASTTTLSGHNDVKTVALTANDGNGNTASCSFTVTLKDVTPPILSCPADRTVNLNVNCQASLANYISLSTVSDNCTATNAIVRVQSPGAGTVVSSVGVTIVTIAATDAVGNTANCTFNVARADVIVPSITCPATQSLELGTGCQAALPNYSSMATAGDNCTPSGSIAKTQTSPVSGTIVSGLGTTLVTLRATDASGKTKTCTFNVSRIDNLAPFCGSGPQGNGQSQAVMTNHRPTNLLQAYQLELFPNPATSEINVSVTGNAPEGSVFEITDIMGKIIQRTDIEPLPGELIQFDLAVLPSGVYLLKWSAGGQVLAGKTFVVVR